MRRAAAVVVVLAMLVVAAPVWSASSTSQVARTGLTPAAAQAVAGAAADGQLAMIVTLTTRADFSALPGRGTGAGRVAAIQALQAVAALAQQGVLGYLSAQQQRGEVSRIEPLWVVDAIGVTATPAVISTLALRADVASIDLDELAVEPSSLPPATAAEPNLSNVHAPDLWAQGYYGQGVVVATLDSGVDITNPDLAATWRGGANSWFDPYRQHSTPADVSGHGTATMGVIAGGESGGSQIGVAPGARWIAAKIFNDRGRATATAIHRSFQWLLDPDGDLATADAPQVVNGSWTYGTTGCDLSFQPDLQALVFGGILPVFAAGNFGPGASTGASPANYPEAVAVGSVDNSDVIQASSSRGPSACGESQTTYPELVAPGVDVATADRNNLSQIVSGTSIAAPHVAGAAALLLSAHPGVGGDALRSALISSAADLGAPGVDNTYGAGRIDVAAAHEWLVANPPPTTTTTTLPPTTTTSTTTTLPQTTTTTAGPDLIFADGFENGSVGTWSASSGSPAVTSDAALTGFYGMKTTITGTTSIYVTDTRPVAESSYHARFRFDPNGSTFTANKTEDVLQALTSSASVAATVQIKAVTGGYEIRVGGVESGTKLTYSSWFALSDAPHTIEIAFLAATTTGGQNGSITLWIDGSSVGSVSSMANGAIRIEEARMGPQGVAKNTVGTQYFDDFVSTRSSYIGS